jgi:hypothetical protein
MPRVPQGNSACTPLRVLHSRDRFACLVETALLAVVCASAIGHLSPTDYETRTRSTTLEHLVA